MMIPALIVLSLLGTPPVDQVVTDPADMKCDPKNPNMCAVYLDKGLPAPFEGVLLTPDLSLQMDVNQREAAARLDLEKATCDKRAEADHAAFQAQLKATVDGEDQQKAAIQKALKDLNDEKLKVEEKALETEIWTGVVAGAVGLVVGAAVGAGVILYLKK